MSRLTIVMLTYNRMEYAEKTIRSTLDNIKYSDELCVHIADDGSPDGYVEHLRSIVGGYDKIHTVSCSNSNRGGYGKNFNLAMSHVLPWSDFLLILEDDWVLTKVLDLDSLSKALCEPFGCMRLGYLGWTQRLNATFVCISGEQYLLLDSNSPEPHVFTGHPRLVSKTWQLRQGPWPEGLRQGDTEFAIAHKPASRMGVLWPLNLIRTYGDLYVHIGAVQA